MQVLKTARLQKPDAGFGFPFCATALGSPRDDYIVIPGLKVG